MTSLASKPAWYHQIRWKLTVGYGFVLLAAYMIAELIFLAFAVGYVSVSVPQVDPAAMFVDRIWAVIADDVLVLPVFLVIGHFISRRFAARIERLKKAVDAWGSGDFTARPEDGSPDEVGILSRQLLLMVGKLQAIMETEQELAKAKERDRIARDLHDSVKQQVFATQMVLAAAQNSFESDPEFASRMLAEAIDLTHESQRELRLLIDSMPPAGLEHRTLGSVLQEYMSRVEALGIDVQIHVEADRDFPIEVEEALYRVAQGALSNIEKHSQATSATVDLEFSNDRITLRISDNGIGFDAETPSMNEFGLESMRTRLYKVGGTLSVASQPDHGTTVTAVAPVPATT